MNSLVSRSHALRPLALCACVSGRHTARRPFASSSRAPLGPGNSSSAKAETDKASSRRGAVTPFNDDGRVPWSELSVVEKAGRATQQTVNYGLIVAGFALTAAVSYLLYTEVFAPDSKTVHFNKAVNRIKRDEQCLAVLGKVSSIKAHGDETGNRWKRSRPITMTKRIDSRGAEHMRLRFYVCNPPQYSTRPAYARCRDIIPTTRKRARRKSRRQGDSTIKLLTALRITQVDGPLNSAVAHVHLVRSSAAGSDFHYQEFFLDVDGHPRIYLERATRGKSTTAGRNGVRFLGINWSAP